MATEVITREDLYEFRILLLNDFKQLLSAKQQTGNEWLKSAEARKLLRISAGTLQNLRLNKTLPYTKMGGIIYYDREDINKILEKNKVNYEPA